MQLTKRDSKQDRLAQVALFASADSKALRNLAQAVDEASVKAGRVFIRQGIHHHQCYVINRGRAAVEIDGREIAEVGDGDMIGELAFFAQALATATVRAKTDLEVLVIPHNRLDHMLANDPQLVRCIATQLAQRLLATDALLG